MTIDEIRKGLLQKLQQGFNNYAQGVQQRYNAPSKVAPPRPNASVQSFVNPILKQANEFITQQGPAYQRISTLANPANPMWGTELRNRISDFQNKGLQQGAINLGTDTLNAGKFGANVLGGRSLLTGGFLNAAKTILPTAALGGGINKAFGGSFWEGAGQGAAISPSIRGITSVTNPLIEQGVSRFAPQFDNIVAKVIAPRLTRGALNVPEGAVIDTSLGRRPLSPESMALDLATGAILPGSPNLRGGAQALDNVEIVKPWQKAFKAASDQGVAERLNLSIKSLEDEMGSATNVLTKKHADVIEEATALFLPKQAQNLPLREKMDVWKYIFARSANMSTDKVPEILKGVDEMLNPKSLTGNTMGIVDNKAKPNVSQPPQGKVKQTFKTEKFNVGKKEEGLIKNLQKQMGLESRDVRTFDEMKAMAEEMGTNPKQLLKDIKTGRITDKEVLSLGNVISTSSQRIQKLSGMLKKNPGNEKLQAQLASEEELINQAIRQRIKGGTEAGRAVAAFRVIANRTLDPSYWLDKAQRQIGDKKELNADVVTAIHDYISKKDRLGLATFISKLGESSGLEKAVGLWKASLLTGLRTHEANIIGNTAMAGLETIKDIPATGFDMARSLITGGPRTKAFGVGTVTDQFPGAFRGIKNAYEVLKTGSDPQDFAKAEFHKPLRYGNTPLGKAAQVMTNAVFRTLGAEDKVFYGAAYNRSMGEQLRLAKMQGKLVTQPTAEMVERAVKDALYSTFTNENALNNALKGAKQAGGKEVAAAIDVIAPFTRTPTNVAKATFIDYTPVGIVKTVAQKIFKRESVDNKQLAEAFGRSLTGTAALWLGAELAKRGLVSGASSSKETERSQAELEQQPSNSVLLNGSWQNVSKISPFGNLILLGAAYYNSGGNLSETAFAGLKGFSENSFLKGVANAGQALNEPKRNGSNFLESAISGYVPTLVSDIARGMDDVRRKPEGLVEKLQARVPGLRQNLPSRLNAMGEPVEEQGNFLSKIANPFNSSKPSDNPIVNEFKRVGYNLNYTGDSISIDGVDTKLNRDQEREYQKLAGKYIQQYIPEFINSSGYKNLSKDDQRDMIEKLVNTAKEQAREELKTKLNSIQPDYGMKAGAAGRDDITFTSSPDKNLIVPQTSASNEVKPVSTPTSDKIIYRDGTSLKTFDLAPPTKGTGIDAFVNSDWKITKAREAWNNQNLSPEDKKYIFEKMGVKAEDVRYDALAHHDVDISTQYIMSKSPDKESLLNNIYTGRMESISGVIFATNGVIDNLVDEGLLTKDEAKQLKALKFDKNGQSIGKSTSTGKKGKKLPKMAVKKANFKIATKQSQAKTIKSGKPTIIKTPKVSFDTQFSRKGSIPQAKKYAVKFNV